MAYGKFITFEGGEGAGKTTQMAHLARRLENAGVDVRQTREPGGSPRAEQIREVLLKGVGKSLGSMAETLLFFAAREDHLEKTIRPFLRAGGWVISDRFTDSTRAYQGAVGGVSEEVLDYLEDIIVGSTRPYYTIILDIPAKEGLARAAARRQKDEVPDRFEAMDIDFHNKLRQAFLKIATKEPERCVVINANATEAHVADEIWKSVKQRFSI
ncbi:MAG: dTMP kinase [Pseudomonadota bacterium]